MELSASSVSCKDSKLSLVFIMANYGTPSTETPTTELKPQQCGAIKTVEFI